MEYVELNRDFAALQKDEEATTNMGRVWGRRYGGWLTWEGLLKYRRIVLLAEASSGKSEEFRAQTEIPKKRQSVSARVMMQQWADYLDKLKTGAHVIRLHGQAA